MPKVTIDGHELEVTAGTTILQAALAVGQEIPHYCYHPGLSIAGNCRMCLVEVEQAPKLVIGCQTPVADGMVVNTHNERVQEAQAAVMEFLLINHPLDCPICDQAGECKLQDYAVECGAGQSRYTEPKLALNKAVDIGRHVMLDQERCIQCSRCIRFCDEVTGTGELAFFQRGARSMIGIAPGRHLDNAYSGNVVDICPVGALTLKEFRFKNRVWYLQNTPTVCAGCARGCNVVAATGTQEMLFTAGGQLGDRVKRLVPRYNEAVNGHWICDEGRLSYVALNAADRLKTAQNREGSEVDWEKAVARAAADLKAAAEHGKAAAILSPRLGNEAFYVWKELLESLGNVRVAVRKLHRGQDDDLLIRADKGANSTGAAWIFAGLVDETDVLAAAVAGELETLLVVGDPLDPADNPELAGVAGKVAKIVYVGPFLDATARAATLRLPMAAWGEEDATYVNFQGRVQRLLRARTSRGEGRPGWRVVADIGVAAGLEPPAWGSSADVFATLAADNGAFASLDYETLGLLGVPGRAGTTAGA
jgi:NADH-quinone oxidoreductase subunit G